MSVEEPSRSGTPTSKDVGASIVRTVTPLLVGLILGVAGTEAAGVTEETLTAAVSTIVAVIYHSGVRLLEQKWPKMGILLGWPTAPTYSKTDRP